MVHEYSSVQVQKTGMCLIGKTHVLHKLCLGVSFSAVSQELKIN